MQDDRVYSHSFFSPNQSSIYALYVVETGIQRCFAGQQWGPESREYFRFFPEREGSKLARKLIQPSQTTYFFSTPETTSAIIPIRALRWSIPGSDSRAATRKCCWLRPNFHT